MERRSLMSSLGLGLIGTATFLPSAHAAARGKVLHGGAYTRLNDRRLLHHHASWRSRRSQGAWR